MIVYVRFREGIFDGVYKTLGAALDNDSVSWILIENVWYGQYSDGSGKRTVMIVEVYG